MQSMRRLCTVSLLLVASAIAVAGTKAEDIVAQHLDSIGTAEARAAVKSRGVQGSLQFKIKVGGTGEGPGTWHLYSEQRRSNFVMKFGNDKWWGEQFIFDGNKTSYARATLSHQWSAFGGFVAGQDSIIKEGLLGGELGTGWALQDIGGHHIALEYAGLKKVDGRELEAIDYISKSNGGMNVRLYFDPETHHHVMTVYSLVMAAGASRSGIISAHQNEVRYTLEERFSDFQTDSGITLPRHYDLQFSQQLQNGTTTVYDWAMTADRISSNPTLDPASFQIK